MTVATRLALLGVSVLAVLLSLVQPYGRPTAPTFWGSLMLRGAVAVEHFDSLAELTSAADLVVVGRIADLSPGRDFGDAVDTVHYASATIVVEQVLAGDPPDKVILELQMPHGQGAADVARYEGEMPRDSVLLFLRNKGVEAAAAGLPSDVVKTEAAFFRLVRPDSLIVAEGGKAKTATGVETSFLVAESGGDFNALVRRIDEIR